MKEIGPDVCDEQAPIRTFDDHDIRCHRAKGHSGCHRGSYGGVTCNWEKGRHHTAARFRATSDFQDFSDIMKRVYGA